MTVFKNTFKMLSRLPKMGTIELYSDVLKQCYIFTSVNVWQALMILGQDDRYKHIRDFYIRILSDKDDKQEAARIQKARLDDGWEVLGKTYKLDEYKIEVVDLGAILYFVVVRKHGHRKKEIMAASRYESVIQRYYDAMMKTEAKWCLYDAPTRKIVRNAGTNYREANWDL
jgi:hypothetical protein